MTSNPLPFLEVLPGTINIVEKYNMKYTYHQDSFYEGDLTGDMFIVRCKTTTYSFLSEKGEFTRLTVWHACCLIKRCSHPLFRSLWREIFYANVIH